MQNMVTTSIKSLNVSISMQTIYSGCPTSGMEIILVVNGQGGVWGEKQKCTFQECFILTCKVVKSSGNSNFLNWIIQLVVWKWNLLQLLGCWVAMAPQCRSYKEEKAVMSLSWFQWINGWIKALEITRKSIQKILEK